MRPPFCWRRSLPYMSCIYKLHIARRGKLREKERVCLLYELHTEPFCYRKRDPHSVRVCLLYMSCREKLCSGERERERARAIHYVRASSSSAGVEIEARRSLHPVRESRVCHLSSV